MNRVIYNKKEIDKYFLNLAVIDIEKSQRQRQKIYMDLNEHVPNFN